MSLTAQNLTKIFNGIAAVDDVSFDVPEGAFFCVVGPSGCGKSTLLRLIAGLEPPDAGRIALAGHDVAAPDLFVPPEARRVGVVFQSYALWPHMSVLQNVAFPDEARGLAKTEALTRAKAHLRTVALKDMADRKPEALSGGQRQRVALARCLSGDAQTVLMDEPLANLDPHLRGAMESELRAFHDRSGVTTLYITHDQREAMALADVLAVMRSGRILQIAAPQEVYARPATTDVAGFIGRGTLLPADMGGNQARIAGQELPVSGGPGDTAFLRPHDIALSDEGLPARITDVHYRGAVWEASARIEGLEAEIMLDLASPVRRGEQVKLRFTKAWIIPESRKET